MIMTEGKISTGEVARMLGVTERRARQLAAPLRAERDELGNWWFDRNVVVEHAEMRAQQGRGQAAIGRLEVRLGALEARVTALEEASQQPDAGSSSSRAGE
jgi:hypothetical protein